MANRWYIYDGEKESGPWPWEEVVLLANKRKITRNSWIRCDEEPNWVPIIYYFHPGWLPSPDDIGLMPGVWDLIFYIAMGVFIIGIFVFFMEPIFGVIFFIISPIFEIFAVVHDRQEKVRSTASSLGLLCAGGWIIFQIAVSIFLAVMLFS